MMSQLRHVARLQSIASAFGHQHQRSLHVASGLSQVVSRQVSSASERQLIRVEKEDGFAVIYLRNEPVNSLSTAFSKEMRAALLELERDPEVQGVIFMSDLQGTFSAGLNLLEFYQQPRDAVLRYCESVYEYCITHYGTSLVTIAAINGHALAGGSILSLLCDYRIMAKGPYRIGVTEVHREVVLPTWLLNLFVNTVGPREAERAVQLGLAYRPEAALKVGFVDEIVDEDKLLDRARDEMKRWLRTPSATRAACKQQVRKPLIEQARQLVGRDTLYLSEQLTSKTVQDNIRRFFEGRR